MDILSKVPERLKELMFDKGINAPKLAEDLDMGSNTITRYLQGIRMPNYYTLLALVDYFHCSADFLLGLDEQPRYESTFIAAPSFAMQFRKAMDDCKVSQYALQKKTKISWNSIHKWLKGERVPYADSLIKIALALDCTVDFLLGRIT